MEKPGILIIEEDPALASVLNSFAEEKGLGTHYIATVNKSDKQWLADVVDCIEKELVKVAIVHKEQVTAPQKSVDLLFILRTKEISFITICDTAAKNTPREDGASMSILLEETTRKDLSKVKDLLNLGIALAASYLEVERELAGDE